MTRTIVLIHGAWLNAVSWENWKSRYEAQGYTVIAPDWPLDDASPAALRAKTPEGLVDVGPREIADHYEAIIRALPERPIIMGHSAGGVWTQIMLDRGLGACGVVINPAPTPGVRLYRHALVSALPVFLSWGSRRRVMRMSPRFFGKRFAQTLPEEVKDETYDRYIVPTPGKVYWQGLTAIKIAFGNSARAPMLLVAGGKDLIADAAMTEAIYRRQKASPSRTEFKLYPGRSHWTCLDAGWEEVADHALDWAVRNARSGEAATLGQAA
jgi:pimeloyl-ACP methyl ester carboxylesterase